MKKRKKERVTFYNEYCGDNKYVEELCKQEIYDKTVDMICDKWKYVETVEHDILVQMSW